MSNFQNFPNRWKLWFFNERWAFIQSLFLKSLFFCSFWLSQLDQTKSVKSDEECELIQLFDNFAQVSNFSVAFES